MDEIALVADLIDVLCREVATTADLPRPVVTVFHVGITRIVGDVLGGEGAARARSLLRDPAVREIVRRGGGDLAVVIPCGLFYELRAEGLPGTDWQHIRRAAVWLRLFGASPDTAL